MSGFANLAFGKTSVLQKRPCGNQQGQKTLGLCSRNSLERDEDHLVWPPHVGGDEVRYGTTIRIDLIDDVWIEIVIVASVETARSVARRSVVITRNIQQAAAVRSDVVEIADQAGGENLMGPTCSVTSRNTCPANTRTGTFTAQRPRHRSTQPRTGTDRAPGGTCQLRGHDRGKQAAALASKTHLSPSTTQTPYAASNICHSAAMHGCPGLLIVRSPPQQAWLDPSMLRRRDSCSRWCVRLPGCEVAVYERRGRPVAGSGQFEQSRFRQLPDQVFSPSRMHC